MGVSDAWRVDQLLMQKPNRKLLIFHAVYAWWISAYYPQETIFYVPSFLVPELVEGTLSNLETWTLTCEPSTLNVKPYTLASPLFYLDTPDHLIDYFPIHVLKPQIFPGEFPKSSSHVSIQT